MRKTIIIMTMKPNTKYEPTTEGDRAITKEMNVWTYTQRKNYENDGNKEKRERNKSEMRNCARIIYGNMLYLNDHFCWKKPFFLILFVSVCLFWLVKCIWGQQNEKFLLWQQSILSSLCQFHALHWFFRIRGIISEWISLRFKMPTCN